jgi:PAS domain S-box-containing protein
MVQDITGRYKAQRKLAESEERYRSMFEQNHSIMLLIDGSDGSIRDANNAALNYYGWSKQEITTMKISEINILPPEEVKKEMQNARENSRNVFHFKHRLANGQVRDLEVYSGMMFNDEKPYLHSIIHDITDRIKAEKKLSESLKEKQVLLTEIHHRVKNNLAIISALLELNLYCDEEIISIEDFVKNSQMKIRAIAEVHELLYESGQFSHISFKEYIERLVIKIDKLSKNKEQSIRIITYLEEVDLNINQAILIGLILDELIMNTLNYSFDGRAVGLIEITMKDKGDEILILVAENGSGAGVKTYQGKTNSLGNTLLNILIQQINGSFDYHIFNEGIQYEIRFNPKNVKGSAGNIF